MRFEELVLGYPLCLEAVQFGEDWRITLTGGQAPHIGAVTAVFRQEGQAALYTVSGQGHRDQVLSERYAEKLEGVCKGSLCIVCGIHYDGLDADGVETVCQAAERLLAQFISFYFNSVNCLAKSADTIV